jgi:hypothetical protein
MFWTVSAGVAQENDTTSDVTLTVEQCLADSTDVSHESFEAALSKQSIIDRDLLQTELVTRDMCADMLERAPSDTLVQRLIAARNYVQEIGLIEGAMREAAKETGAKRTNRPVLAKGSLLLVSDLAQSSAGAAQAQYGDDEPTPGGGAAGGGEGLTGVSSTTKQAAAISGTAQTNSNASIEEQLDAGTDAGVRAGASRPEAAAGTKCSLEVTFLKDFVRLIPGSYRLTPEKVPKELRYGTTRRIRLSISPETREVFEKIRQKNAAVAEASESNIECVSVTTEMKATLGSLHDLDISSRDESVKPLFRDESTVWEWYVTGKPEGRQSLYLDLSYKVSPPHQDARFLSHEPPLLEKAILVESTPVQNLSGFVGGDWLSFSDFIVALVSSILVPVALVLLRRRRKRLSSIPTEQQPAEPKDEGPA